MAFFFNTPGHTHIYIYKSQQKNRWKNIIHIYKIFLTFVVSIKIENIIQDISHTNIFFVF